MEFKAPFQITRGIRQGCSLSLLLYAISAEGLGTLIRSNCKLQGIHFPGSIECIKLIQHADDTTVFFSKDNDFDALKDVLCKYCNGSGSKVNTSKTMGLWLGKWRNINDKPCNFIWNNDKLKKNCIYVGNTVTPEELGTQSQQN